MEQSRQKEGMSFQEAYLLPIPVVQATVDFEEKSFTESLEKTPGVIANSCTFLDIPSAEPADYRSQYRYLLDESV